MSAIPGPSRVVVANRYAKRCAHCGLGARGGQWHHRRSRSVVDEHTHCPCNGVWLCSTCHAWAHAQPKKAREEGYIVSRYVAEPFTVPITTRWGVRTHDCRGVSL